MDVIQLTTAAWLTLSSAFEAFVRIGIKVVVVDIEDVLNLLLRLLLGLGGEPMLARTRHKLVLVVRNLDRPCSV